MTAPFSSPAPQWTDPSAAAAAVASRLNPVLDTSGFWVLRGLDVAPSGAFVEHGSGFTIIDDTLTVGLNATLLPSGFVVAY